MTAPVPTAESIRVAVVDDDDASRTSLVRLLRLEHYDAQGFDAPTDFLATVGARPFACAILDLRMPGMTGLELQRALAERAPAMPVLFLSAFGTIPESVRAMKEGAVDFLEKPVRPDAILDAVQRAVATVQVRAASDARREAARSRLADLSPREREVLHAVVRGRLNKQIAADLGITVRTVKFHRARMMEKTGAESVPELVRLLDDAGERADD